MNISEELIEKTLSSATLRDKSKALFLLKMCQLSQIFKPEKTMHYWQQLSGISGKLPLDNREIYKDLKDSLESRENTKEKKGFAAEINNMVIDSSKYIESSPDKAVAGFRECEEKIRKRMWPFGKRMAWESLVHAWAAVDREAALRLINKVSNTSAESLIQKLNVASPLTPDEWDKAQKSLGDKIIDILKGMLDQSGARLKLSSDLAGKVSKNLVSDLIKDKDANPEAKPDVAYDRFERLIIALVAAEKEFVNDLMSDFYQEIVTSDRFGESFSKGFTLLRRGINIWVRVKESNPEAFDHISKNTPEFLKDFALSQWLSMVSNTEEQAVSNLRKLSEMSSSFADAEAWFLVILVSRGLGEISIKLAGESENSGALKSRMRCALVNLDQNLAKKHFKDDDFKDDLIGQFLLKETAEERVAFLKEQMNNNSSFISEIWKKPDLSVVERKDKKTLYHFYYKNTTKDNQFKEMLRLQGFHNYGYSDVDAFLLSTLCSWGDEDPGAVRSFLENLLNKMWPNETEIRVDLLRNTMFERCRLALAADVKVLEQFIQKVKKKLVDNSYQWQYGQTMYTLHLKPETLFLFCIIGAEQVNKISPKRADDIILHAMEKYTGSEDIIKYSAELYARNNGFEAFDPPLKLSRGVKDDWQTAVVQAVVPFIVDSFAKESEKALSAAAS